MGLERRRWVVDREHPSLSMTRSGTLLGVRRSGMHHRPTGPPEEDLALIQAMDRQYLETLFYVPRRMSAWLEREGRQVGRKRVQRLISPMSLRAIYRSPRTSRCRSMGLSGDGRAPVPPPARWVVSG